MERISCTATRHVITEETWGANRLCDCGLTPNRAHRASKEQRRTWLWLLAGLGVAAAVVVVASLAGW